MIRGETRPENITKPDIFVDPELCIPIRNPIPGPGRLKTPKIVIPERKNTKKISIQIDEDPEIEIEKPCCTCCTWIIDVFIAILLHIFYATIEVDCLDKIPKKGPILFVCAPHANQLIDPLLVRNSLPYDVSFVAAAKTMNRPVVGQLSKWLGSIPVRRPQDEKVLLQGLISITGDTVTGVGTRFLTDFPSDQNSSIYIHQNKTISKIDFVKSQTELKLLKPLDDDEDIIDSPISCVPCIDQNDVYENVFRQLGAGHSVAIFPEGGSHDRTELLPLKAGVTIMALGAMERYPNLDLKIVPCGLTFFAAHQWRSTAYICFGEPIGIPKVYLHKYKQGGIKKREACGALLEDIYLALGSIVNQTPDSNSLKLFLLARRLFTPKDVILDLKDKMALNRLVSSTFYRSRHTAQTQAMLMKLQEYSDRLKTFRVKDRDVTLAATTSPCKAICVLCWRIPLFIITSCLSLPGLLLYWPMFLLIHLCVRKIRKEAKQTSSVKIEALDVVTTAHATIGFVAYPIYTMCLSIGIWFLLYLVFEAVLLICIICNPLTIFVTMFFLSYASMIVTSYTIRSFYDLQPLFLALAASYCSSCCGESCCLCCWCSNKFIADPNQGTTVYGDQNDQDFDIEHVMSDSEAKRKASHKQNRVIFASAIAPLPFDLNDSGADNIVDSMENDIDDSTNDELGVMKKNDELGVRDTNHFISRLYDFRTELTHDIKQLTKALLKKGFNNDAFEAIAYKLGIKLVEVRSTPTQSKNSTLPNRGGNDTTKRTSTHSSSGFGDRVATSAVLGSSTSGPSLQTPIRRGDSKFSFPATHPIQNDDDDDDDDDKRKEHVRHSDVVRAIAPHLARYETAELIRKPQARQYSISRSRSRSLSRSRSNIVIDELID